MINNNYERKYIKYKKKYLGLKKIYNMCGGIDLEFENDEIDCIDKMNKKCLELFDNYIESAIPNVSNSEIKNNDWVHKIIKSIQKTRLDNTILDNQYIIVEDNNHIKYNTLTNAIDDFNSNNPYALNSTDFIPKFLLEKINDGPILILGPVLALLPYNLNKKFMVLGTNNYTEELNIELIFYALHRMLKNINNKINDISIVLMLPIEPNKLLEIKNAHYDSHHPEIISLRIAFQELLLFTTLHKEMSEIPLHLRKNPMNEDQILQKINIEYLGTTNKNMKLDYFKITGDY